MATTQAAAALSIRPLTVAQLEQTCAMQQLVMPSPWSLNQWRTVMSERYVSQVVVVGGRLSAVAVFSTVLDEAELETIFVHPDYRRKGIAGKLLAYCLEILNDGAIRSIYLEVDSDNRAAIKLYERFGFVAGDVRKGYYANSSGDGDALMMRREQ